MVLYQLTGSQNLAVRLRAKFGDLSFTICISMIRPKLTSIGTTQMYAKEAQDIVNYWRQKGVKGFRFDVLNVIGKDEILVDSTDPVQEKDAFIRIRRSCTNTSKN